VRAAAIVYHRGASRLYEQRWLDRCVASIRGQTLSGFDVLEMDYGAEGERLAGLDADVFLSRPLGTFADAANYLLDAATEMGYDVVFNTHVDDFSAPERFALEVAAIEAGADLVSTDFAVVGADDEVLWSHFFHELDLAEEFARGHNIMCHSSVAYTSRFWRGCSRYRPEEIPAEDFALWLREAARWDIRLIGPVLHYCRDHPHRTSRSENR
jgi:hypothetical protein